ncbi:LexA repressor [subsurface metagenome]
MEPLTEKQKRALDFITDRLRENSPPSQREIAGHFGLTQNAAYQLIRYLKKKGYLADIGGHRGLRLSERYVKKIRHIENVPIVGRVAAGRPTHAEENIEGYIRPERIFGRSKNVFALKIVGDSMVDEGIMDGDFVVVEPDVEIKDGQIAVVMLDGEATVKKIFVRRDRIALKPANRTAGYKTRYIKRSETNARIIGKVISRFKLLG